MVRHYSLKPIFAAILYFISSAFIAGSLLTTAWINRRGYEKIGLYEWCKTYYNINGEAEDRCQSIIGEECGENCEFLFAVQLFCTMAFMGLVTVFLFLVVLAITYCVDRPRLFGWLTDSGKIILWVSMFLFLGIVFIIFLALAVFAGCCSSKWRWFDSDCLEYLAGSYASMCIGEVILICGLLLLIHMVFWKEQILSKTFLEEPESSSTIV